MAPERIGRYPVLDRLGSGGFATVYLAEDRNLGGLVAVKVLSETQLDRFEIVERFIGEARLMRTLAAPGVVTVHDSGEHEGRPYFVMEYCPRGTLEQRLARLGRPLTVDEGFGLATAIANALSFVHRADPPVVHRDVKPGNLLIRHTPRQTGLAVGGVLGQDEELIVGDFGLAKVVDPEATRLTLVAYTRGFAAPEQVAGDPTIGPAADVYAASAVVVSAVTGVGPRQVFSHDQRAFDPEVVQRTGPLGPVLGASLSPHPVQRPPSIVAWRRALDAAWTATGPTSSWARPAGSPGLGSGPPGAGVDPLWSAPTRPGTPDQVPFPVPAAVQAGSGDAAIDWSRRRLVVGAAALAATATVGGVAAWRLLAGSPILGPVRGAVGDQVAFTVPGATVREWEAGGSTHPGPHLVFTPRSPGRVGIVARLVDGATQTTTFEAVEAPSSLRIGGDALVTVGRPVELGVDGVDGADDTTLVWRLGGGTREGPSVVFTAASEGLVPVEVTAGDGRSASRSLLVVGSSADG